MITTAFDGDLADASVLVVDDEAGIRHFLEKSLSKVCARVDTCADTAAASEALDDQSYDVIILDNVMPEQTGLEWLLEQRAVGLMSDVIVITAYADLETAIEAIRVGASDFILKPFRSNQVLNAIRKCLARSELKRQNSALRHELSEGRDIMRHRDSLIGSSEASEAVRAQIIAAAARPANVVFEGEAGLGKQIAARMFHAASERKDKPFSALHCYGLTAAALQDRLNGSLPDEREGMLRYANGGTIYLEDADLLDSASQNVLLDWLTSGKFRPEGGSRSFTTDIRLICSTTRALKSAVAAGAFHPDLYYLLSIHAIRLAPLRERPADVPEIAEVFVEEMAAKMGVARVEISATAKRKLMAHDWPGNVMELRNLVERALITGSFEAVLATEGPMESESLAAVEQRHILRVLEASGGNRAEAARRLGVARKTIDRKCQAWNV